MSTRPSTGFPTETRRAEHLDSNSISFVVNSLVAFQPDTFQEITVFHHIRFILYFNQTLSQKTSPSARYVFENRFVQPHAFQKIAYLPPNIFFRKIFSTRHYSRLPPDIFLKITRRFPKNNRLPPNTFVGPYSF